MIPMDFTLRPVHGKGLDVQFEQRPAIVSYYSLRLRVTAVVRLSVCLDDVEVCPLPVAALFSDKTKSDMTRWWSPARPANEDATARRKTRTPHGPRLLHSGGSAR